LELSYVPSESLDGSAKVRRAARAREIGGPASRPAGIVEEEGTIRGQIKTRRRVTAERVRNERVCDFGHAVRLYVDLRSTGGTERRSGEKGGSERAREREREGGMEERNSVYSAFVPSSSRRRAREPFDSPRFELARCHHWRETDQGKETVRGHV